MNARTLQSLSLEIQEIFAEVTRYPHDILDVDASLEEDLGIDSVKLGEIFSVLRERYQLPEKIGLPPDSLKTIAGISTALTSYLATQQAAAATHPVAAHSAGFGADSGPDVQARVREVFAEVTRYPLEILDVDASLEEDLGIDSVKLGEIFSVLREQYTLPEKLDIPAERLKTIAGIAQALGEHLARSMPVSALANGHAPEALVPNSDPPALREPASAALTALLERAKSSSTVPAAPSPAPRTAPERPLRGKIGFVSGSGRGMGKDIAVHLAELGATMVVNSFHSRQSGDETAAEIQGAGGQALHLWGSMANPAQLHRIFDEIDERYGKLDFFVSNASNGMLAPIEDLTVEHWEKAFRTNVVGLHQGALRAARLMRPNGGGKIITLSSPAAHGYVDYFGCMGPVKAAVESLTRALAIEFAKDNIQVNCVSPGPVDGELLRKWPESDRLIDQWTRATPLGRLVEHREVSQFIAYLLSEPVKAFTGSVLVLDGGISSQGW